MSQSLSGSKAALKLNGKKVVYVGSVNISEENGTTPINVLDQLDVAENVETSHIVSFTASLFKVNGNSAAQLGLRTSDIKGILSRGTFTMEVYNNVDGRVEYSMTGVKWTGGSGTLDARGVWQGTWNFVGIRGGNAETDSL